MCIKASKFLIIGIQFVFSFLLIGLPSLLIFGSSMDDVVFILFLCLSHSFFYLIFTNNNIEILDKDCVMGGSANKSNRIRTQEFVSKQNIDLVKSQERTFFDRLIGRYKIYNIHGKGFIINRYFLSRMNFKIVENKLFEILGVKYV